MAGIGAGVYHPDSVFLYLTMIAKLDDAIADDAVAQLKSGGDVIIAIPSGKSASISPGDDGLFNIREAS